MCRQYPQEGGGRGESEQSLGIMVNESVQMNFWFLFKGKTRCRVGGVDRFFLTGTVECFILAAT